MDVPNTKDESVVLIPKGPLEEIILPQNADELAKFMDQPLTAIAEAITGALASGPKAWTLMSGHIVQGMLKGKLFQEVCREIKELREKGKIPEDFAEKKNGFKSWTELLKIIDEEAPDEEKLEALKAMFYSVNKTTVQDRERIFNYQLFQIAKRLTSGELLTLRGVYKTYRTGRYEQGTTETMKTWAAQVSNQTEHGSPDFVLRHQFTLEQEGLITEQLMTGAAPYVRQDQNVWNKNGRITPLGIAFCENIEAYRMDIKDLERG